jgi:hypothetical protein
LWPTIAEPVFDLNLKKNELQINSLMHQFISFLLLRDDGWQGVADDLLQDSPHPLPYSQLHIVF